MSTELLVIVGVWAAIAIIAVIAYGFRQYECRGLHHCLCKMTRTCKIDD